MKLSSPRACLWALACAAGLCVPVGAQDAAPPPAGPPETIATAEPVATPAPTTVPAPVPDPRVDQLLSELQSQREQSRAMMEELRVQATEARLAREVSDARLKLIEHTISEQRDAELSALRSANRLNLALGIAFVLIGVGGAAAVGFLLLRAVHRMGELPAQLLLGNLPHGHAGTLPDAPRATPDPRLGDLMARIEERMRTLESTANAKVIASPATERRPAGSDTAKLSKLMATGNEHFAKEEFHDALECYEAVLRSDGAQVDAILRAAKALEKLGRLDEAVESYDRALALDGNLTVAYLGKGSALNRLERFDESLECYERALNTKTGQMEAGPIVVRE